MIELLTTNPDTRLAIASLTAPYMRTHTTDTGVCIPDITPENAARLCRLFGIHPKFGLSLHCGRKLLTLPVKTVTVASDSN